VCMHHHGALYRGLNQVISKGLFPKKKKKRSLWSGIVSAEYCHFCEIKGKSSTLLNNSPLLQIRNEARPNSIVTRANGLTPFPCASYPAPTKPINSKSPRKYGPNSALFKLFYHCSFPISLAISL